MNVVLYFTISCLTKYFSFEKKSFLGLHGLHTSQLFFPSIFRKPRLFRLTNHSESRDHPVTLLLVYVGEWPTLNCFCRLSSIVSVFSIKTWRVSYVCCCWCSSALLRSRRRRQEAATCRQQVRGESGNLSFWRNGVIVCFSRFVLPLKSNKTSCEGLNFQSELVLLDHLTCLARKMWKSALLEENFIYVILQSESQCSRNDPKIFIVDVVWSIQLSGLVFLLQIRENL